MAKLENGGRILRLNNVGLNEITKCIMDHLTLVEILELNHNSIKEIEKIDSQILQCLEMAFNQFTGKVKISLLKLIKLNLSYNKLTGIEITTRSIQELNLENNRIQKIDFLTQLKDLRYLNLSNNGIEKVDFLVFNTQLQEFRISNNRITSLNKAFINTPKISILDVSYNYLTNISFIDTLCELSQLYVCSNKLIELKFESKNDNLNILDISFNSIEDIRIIEFKFQYITHLYLNSNNIYAQNTIDFLKLMTNLQEIYFQENPFYSLEYEDEFIVACPQLEVINGREVGKPGQYVRNEYIKLKQHLKEIDIDVDKISLSDIDEKDIVTEERIKAILRVEGFSDDETQIIQKQEQIEEDEIPEKQFFDLIENTNEQMNLIRAQYLERLNKNNNSQREINYESNEFNNQNKYQTYNTDVNNQNNNETQQSQNQIKQADGKKLLIRSMPKQIKKPSILQEIAQLKSKDKEFYSQLGFRDGNRGSIMNRSSENFNNKRSSSNRVLQSATLKLPKI